MLRALCFQPLLHLLGRFRELPVAFLLVGTASFFPFFLSVFCVTRTTSRFRRAIGSFVSTVALVEASATLARAIVGTTIYTESLPTHLVFRASLLTFTFRSGGRFRAPWAINSLWTTLASSTLILTRTLAIVWPAICTESFSRHSVHDAPVGTVARCLERGPSATIRCCTHSPIGLRCLRWRRGSLLERVCEWS